MKKNYNLKRLASVVAALIALCMLFTLIPSMAETVSDEEKARIVTHGYDLSEFTVIDDTDESVIISGLAETSGAAYLCGQAHFTGATASMTLDFEGNAIGFIAQKGGFEIVIDDETVDNVWASSVGAPQVVFYTETLSNDSHTITVITDPSLASEKIGENYSVLEGFFVQTTPGTGSATGGNSEFDPSKQDIAAEERAKINAGDYDLSDFRIVDDCAPGVVATGLSVTEHASHLCGNANFTAGTGSLTLSFEGTAIGILAEKGGFEVEIDGNVVGRFGCASIGAPQVLFYTEGLSSGIHTVKVTTVPDVSREHTGEAWSVLEGFFVQIEPGKGSANGVAAPTDEPTNEPTEEPTEEPTQDIPQVTDKPADPTSEPQPTTAEQTPSTGDNNLLPLVIVAIGCVVGVFLLILGKKKSKG